MIDKWDDRFLRLAKEVSWFSKDPKTKVGSVIVNDQHNLLSIGYNGFPRGVNDTTERLQDKTLKHLLTIHAEENAIANAAASVEGATLYVTARPCCRCAMRIIQNGIRRIVYLNPHPEDWHNDNQEVMFEALAEAGVEWTSA